MQQRPRIKLPLTPLDKTLERISILCLFLLWGLAIYSVIKLPSIIPIHFNASGKADSYGSKMTLFFLPVLGSLLWLGITQLNKYPHIFNYMTTITEENVHRQYSIATRMLRYLKLAIIIIFCVIIVFIYLSATGQSNGPGLWFLPFTLALILIPTVISISQSLKAGSN